MSYFFILIIIAYLAGSINMAIILFRITGKGDPRDKYSQNPGATNIYRQAGLIWALAVLLLDGIKAFGVAFAALYFLNITEVPCIGFFLILGNRFPCFHKFRGGKGVANYLGFTTIINPVSAMISIIIWIFIYALFRLPFVSSFCMVFVLLIGTITKCGTTIIPISGAIMTAGFIILNHHKNIRGIKTGKA